MLGVFNLYLFWPCEKTVSCHVWPQARILSEAHRICFILIIKILSQNKCI